MTLLVRCDAKDFAKHVEPGSAELAYLDPPFLVGIVHGARTKPKQGRATGPRAYVDRWPSIEAYIAWLEPRLRVVRELLSDEGTMWLHLDHRAVHEAKIACDAIFGRAMSIGEVIWVPGNGAKARRGPGATHQTLLVFGKTKNFVWNTHDPILRESFAQTSLSMHFKKRDKNGRAYRDRSIGKKTYRYYADEGRALGSVWTDCPSMTANTPLRKETTGYPTQKPLKLLERIVRASSRPGALVIDPFCGSGTTLVAARALDRRAAGCDIGALAIRVARGRLKGS